MRGKVIIQDYHTLYMVKDKHGNIMYVDESYDGQD